jgi:hypothetical protein
MSMKIHIFDIEFVKEYFGTCGEYIAIVKKPFQTIPFKGIWSCNQSNWEDAFRTWGAFQVWLAGITISLSNLLVIISFPEYIGGAIMNIIYGVLVAYITAHLGWFSVTKKDGCCCGCCVCCSGQPVFILLMGIWCILWGLQAILGALTFLGYGGVAILSAIFYIVYAVSLIYMGVCLIRIFNGKGSKVTPIDTSVQSSVVPAQEKMGNDDKGDKEKGQP